MNKVDPVFKVTRIKNKWHARLIINDSVYDEMATDSRNGIGRICKIMSRWYEKCNIGSAYTCAARHRNNEVEPIEDFKIWYMNELKGNRKFS